MKPSGAMQEPAGSEPGADERLVIRGAPLELRAKLRSLAVERGVSPSRLIIDLLQEAVSNGKGEDRLLWAVTDPQKWRSGNAGEPGMCMKAVATNMRLLKEGGHSYEVRGRLARVDGTPLLYRDFSETGLGRAWIAGRKVWVSPDAGRMMFLLTQVWFGRTSTVIEMRLDLRPEAGVMNEAPTWDLPVSGRQPAEERRIIEHMETAAPAISLAKSVRKVGKSKKGGRNG